MLGHIPHYTEKIWPQLGKTANAKLRSLDTFGVCANIGLIFFMFLMGLELESGLIKKVWKKALPIAGMLRLSRQQAHIDHEPSCSGVYCLSLRPGRCPVPVVVRHQQLQQRPYLEKPQHNVIHPVLRDMPQLHGVPCAERHSKSCQARAVTAWWSCLSFSHQPLVVIHRSHPRRLVLQPSTTLSRGASWQSRRRFPKMAMQLTVR